MDFREDTTPLLRNDQIDELKGTLRGLETTLNAPDHIRSQIQDPKLMLRQLRQVAGMLETGTPKPYRGKELDSAVKRKNELEAEIKQGMLTAEEMRKSPPGAVQRHMDWDSRNKQKILEWKNICRKLQHGGNLADNLGDDIANVERLRPQGGAQEANMHGALIEGTEYHMPDVPNSVVMSDQEIDTIKELDSELAAKLATLDPAQRMQVKNIIAEFTSPQFECGAAKKGGGICNFKVTRDGDRCHHHKDQ